MAAKKKPASKMTMKQYEQGPADNDRGVKEGSAADRTRDRAALARINKSGSTLPPPSPSNPKPARRLMGQPVTKPPKNAIAMAYKRTPRTKKK